MLSPETYAHLDHYPIYLQWDAEREEREREREDRMKAAAAAYNPDIHDEDSVWFRDTYTGPSERELMGGCNRCGGMDDCYCIECQTCKKLPCVCPSPDFWQVLVRLTHHGERLESHGKRIWFTDESVARARLQAIVQALGAEEVTVYGLTVRPEVVHEPASPCGYCMGKGRVSYGEDREPIPCSACQNKDALKIAADFASEKWNQNALARHEKECAGWIDLTVKALASQEEEEE